MTLIKSDNPDAEIRIALPDGMSGDQLPYLIAKACIIEKFNELENHSCLIISQFYLGKPNSKFIIEVLEDNNSSFSLKMNILEKIVKQVEMWEDDNLQNLRKMNKIRNYYAHRNYGMYMRLPRGKDVNDAISDVEYSTPDPKNPNVNIEFEELYGQFMNKYPKVNDYLFRIFEKIGGKFDKDANGYTFVRHEE